MEAKKSVNTNKYSEPILSSNDLINLLLQDKNINHSVIQRDEEIHLYDQYKNILLGKGCEFYESNDNNQLSFDEYHDLRSNEWTFPKEYQNIDILAWLLDKADTEEKKNRVLLEYKMYEERDLIMILKLFRYLVDFLRENNYILGVGRGSAVSSYILYLIGVHKINPLKYHLEITEFLK